MTAERDVDSKPHEGAVVGWGGQLQVPGGGGNLGGVEGAAGRGSPTAASRRGAGRARLRPSTSLFGTCICLLV